MDTIWPIFHSSDIWSGHSDKLNSLIIDEVPKPTVCFEILAEMSSNTGFGCLQET